MAVVPTSQISPNRTIGRGLYFPPTPFEESAREKSGSAAEPESTASKAKAPESISAKEASELVEAIVRELTAKPAELALRLHTPEKPSLLGQNYV